MKLLLEGPFDFKILLFTLLIVFPVVIIMANIVLCLNTVLHLNSWIFIFGTSIVHMIFFPVREFVVVIFYIFEYEMLKFS